MKEKQVACLVLIILIAGFAFATQKIYRKMSDAKTKATETADAAELAKTQFNMAQQSLTRLKANTKEVRDFHAAWEPHFTATANWQSTEQQLLDSIKDSDIFPEEQRFELLEKKEDALVKQTLRAHLVLQDEYSKVLNWFGYLEETFPTSRVTSCILTRGKAGDNIRIELILDFPVTGKKAA